MTDDQAVPEDLKSLAGILADWAAPAPGISVYLFGSRVRGDHRPDSDVDVCFKLGDKFDEADAVWWETNQSDFFAAITARLPGPLKWLDHNDPLWQRVVSGKVIYQDRSVYCVWLEPRDPSVVAAAHLLVARRQRRREGAAHHEAGHVIVARHYGLTVGSIWINETDGGGGAKISQDGHLTDVDRIAVCYAGLVAQDHFKMPTNNCAGRQDLKKICEVANGMRRQQRRTAADQGMQRARNIIVNNEKELRRLADELARRRRMHFDDMHPPLSITRE